MIRGGVLEQVKTSFDAASGRWFVLTWSAFPKQVQPRALITKQREAHLLLTPPPHATSKRGVPGTYRLRYASFLRMLPAIVGRAQMVSNGHIAVVRGAVAAGFQQGTRQL